MNYTQEVFSDYKKRSENKTLSVRLLVPTPSGLKEECIHVYREKKLPKTDKVLRSFFGPLDNDDDYLQSIRGYDVDKFKPLVNFLNGKTTKTNIKNIELLAWLMSIDKKVDDPKLIQVDENNSDVSGDLSLEDMQPENKANEQNIEPSIGEQGKPILRFSLKQFFIISIILLIIASFSFLVWKYQNDSINISENEKCMYWTGEQYEAISCEQQSDAIKISLNIQKLNNLKKIDNYDKLTKNDLGKVWYSNIDKKLEFFTDSGIHPVDTAKKLKPLTPYILNKYVSYHRYLLNMLIWSFGIAVSLIAMIYFVFNYLKKNREIK